ncbi:hypothetical protein ACFFIX_12480 [Metabacillus herbersteinensis]|uniref:DUF3967 domain-containing protein n=1 Tax=Metabacillus herbersteinensis TaxID=283816 RepID=A0ABV6GEY9_9BACI
MEENQLNRMEEMLAKLISMVGSVRSEQKADEQLTMKEEQSLIRDEQLTMREEQSMMKEEQSLMRGEQSSIKEELKLMRNENEKRHVEVLSRFQALEADHEHTWEKTVRNEREIAVIKKPFEL